MRRSSFGVGPAVEGSTAGSPAEAGLPQLGARDDGGQAVVEEELADALPRGEDAHALPADQLGVADADADQLAVGQEESAAGPAVLGGPGGDEEEPFVAAVVELEPEGLDQPGGPAREPGPQVDADRGDERIGGRLRGAGASRAT